MTPPAPDPTSEDILNLIHWLVSRTRPDRRDEMYAKLNAMIGKVVAELPTESK
jgi:hypothetical protein